MGDHVTVLVLLIVDAFAVTHVGTYMGTSLVLVFLNYNTSVHSNHH